MTENKDSSSKGEQTAATVLKIKGVRKNRRRISSHQERRINNTQ